MKTITATWKNGKILPDAPGEWPEGCRLKIEPIALPETMGAAEEGWSNSPEGIAAWLQWYDSLEPLEFTPGEVADLAAWREKVKEHSKARMDKGIEGWFP